MKLPSETECIKCEEATYEQQDGDWYCPNCHYVKRSQTGNMQQQNNWEWFWQQRQQYSGFRGPDRVKMVGGFVGAWDADEL